MALIDDLIAWWDGEDATDSHGNHHLSPVGSPVHSTGLVGDAFEGGGGYWRILNADASDFDIGTGDYTIALWVEIDASESNTDGLFEYGNPTNTEEGIAIHISGGNNMLILMSDGTTKVSKYFGLGLSGGWHCIVVKCEAGGDLSLYVDDALEDTVSISSFSGANIQPSTDLYVSHSTATATNSLPLDSVAVWPRLLTSGEATDYYNSGSGVGYVDEAALPAIANRYLNTLASNAAEITVSVNGSSEWATGDLIIIFATIDGDQTTSGVTCDLSGTTQAWEVAAVEGSGSVTDVCFYKEIVSGDTSTTSVEVAWTDSSEKATIDVFRIPAALHDGIDGTAVGSDQGDTSTPSSQSVTTTVDGSLVFLRAGNDGGATATRPSGTGLVNSHAADGGGLVTSAVAILRKDTAGATGAKAWTLSSSRAVVAGTIAIKAVSAGATGTGSLTDAGETIAGTGSATNYGTGSLTDDGETIAGTGVTTAAASGSLTDGGETIAGTGSVVVTGSGALIDTGETLSGAGTVGSLVSGSGGITDGGEFISGAGLVLVSGSGSITDGTETIVGVAAVLVSGSGSITDGGEILSGSDQASGSVDDIEMSATPYLEITMTVEPYVE